MKWNPKDKLYVNPYGWNSKPSRKDETVYIRKDALMEWLKDMIDYSSKERQGAYKNVIEKIESL